MIITQDLFFSLKIFDKKVCMQVISTEVYLSCRSQLIFMS